MKNNIFLDSNILIYFYTQDESNKKDVIEKILNHHTKHTILISTQVLFEFSFVMQRKFKRNYEEIEVSLREIKAAFTIVIINFDTFVTALKIASMYKYSFPDSLIIATALENDCSLLYSEDMHNNQILEGQLIITNPFV